MPSLMFCAVAVIAIFIPTIYFLFAWRRSYFEREFAKRNVRYVSVNNALVSVLRKERTELTFDAIFAREGIRAFGFQLFGNRTIMVNDPDIAQLVLSKEFTNFTNRRIIKIEDPVLGSVLSGVFDEQWKRLRSVVTPTFSAGSLRRMKPRIDETVQNLIGHFERALKEQNNDNNNIEVKRLFGAYTMDTIIRVAFGAKVDSLVEPNNPVIANARKVFSRDISARDFVPLLLLFTMPRVARFFNIRFQGAVVDFFQDFSQNIIAKKKAELARGQGRGKASNFLELVLEAEDEFMQQESKEQKETKKASDENENEVDTQNTSTVTTSTLSSSKKYMTTNEMVAQCVLFFLAGYDTTATTITLATYLLAFHPEAQETLYAEIETVIGRLREQKQKQQQKTDNANNVDDTIELITFEDLPKFEFLNAVISETLRLYAPATIIERSAAKDITLTNGSGSVRIDARAGDVISFPVYTMHRDPEQFPEPESFRPQRFMPPESADFHRYSYLPFGAGPRNCVAKSLALLEAKLALLHTVRRFRFSRSEKTKVPFEMYYQNNFISPRDIILKVEKRI